MISTIIQGYTPPHVLYRFEYKTTQEPESVKVYSTNVRSSGDILRDFYEVSLKEIKSTRDKAMLDYPSLFRNE